eukprot:CAMPEP_0194367082 /NCGR_PEP_ID=MMETSP0174-20130528/15181_1 /TAXON_ID=216777 /ORGANISM="Proboscia alata, Strain PI-D3" /LENGTH=214 /DNA_ID=CAMNT_0039142653 /DNA_START=105 /DNA_END=749 /DNA_ORIENTATION=+
MSLAATTTATAKRLAVGKLSPKSSAFLLCDIQDKFCPLIYKNETVVRTAKLLTCVARELDIPLIGTEQYPKAFGHTLPSCFADEEHLKNTPIFEKKLFSMMTPEVSTEIEKKHSVVKSFVLFGVETHVCVQQTALDLLELGHQVHIVEDGTSSMQPLDRNVALRRMASAGAFVSTAQSICFMLLGSADHPNFKAVSKLIKEHATLPNEFNDTLL